MKVVDKYLLELSRQLIEKAVSVEFTMALKQWLVDIGYDIVYGARPLARVIQDYIKKPLAEELLFGKLSKGGYVTIDIDSGKPKFIFLNAREKEALHQV